MKMRLGLLFILASLLLVVKINNAPAWGDPWELSIVAYVLGITHPPGYPLIVLLAKIIQMFPIPVYLASNLLALFAVSVCAVLIARLVALLSSDETKPWCQLWGMAAGILFILTPLALHLGTVLEVYAPATALTLFLLYNALADWYKPDVRRLVLASLVMGLALTAHFTVILLLPSLLILHLGQKRRWYLLPLAALFILLGFSVSLMQPLRATLFLSSDWAHPSSWERWLTQVTAAQYSGFWGEEGLSAQWGARLLELIGKIAAWGFVPFALGGMAILFRKRKSIAVALMLFWFLTLLVPSFYSIWDIDTYYLPWLAISLVLGGVVVINLAAGRIWRLILTVSIVATGIIACFFLFYLPFKPLGKATLPYARLCLTETPYHCIIFSIGNPSLVPEAMRSVDGLRPDVMVVSRPRFTDYWFWHGWEKRGFKGIPSSEDIRNALSMTPSEEVSVKSYFAKSALTLVTNGWEGMGAVAWTPGPDLAIDNYPLLVELKPNWPIWLWRREPFTPNEQVEDVIAIARRSDPQAVDFFSLELNMAQQWAERWGDNVKAWQMEQWRQHLGQGED